MRDSYYIPRQYEEVVELEVVDMNGFLHSSQVKRRKISFYPWQMRLLLI
jgi:hypothetical protein